MDVPRRLPLLLPPVAVLVAAVVFLGPGKKHAAVSARVRGAVAIGASTLALRIEGVRSDASIEDAAALDELDVEAIVDGLDGLDGARVVATTPRSGKSGVVEARLDLPAPARGAIPLRVLSHATGKLVAKGTIEPSSPKPIFVTIGTAQGRSKGDLPIRVDVERGVLAASFPETIVISVGDGGSIDVGRDSAYAGRSIVADVEASITGGSLAERGGAQPNELDGKSAITLKTDAHGRATIRVMPLAHQSELSIQARAGDRKGTWEGTLPVVPGAIWAHVNDDDVTLISPSPRSEAYVSVWDGSSRVDGAVVPLAKDDRGFFRGSFRPSRAKAQAFAVMNVASDPFERGPATVAWPLVPASGAAPPLRLTLLVDGVPDAVEREKARAYAARRAGALWLAAAALVEVMLVLAASRASQQKLEGHFAGAVGGDGEADALDEGARAEVARAGRAPVLRALLFAAVIALAFAGVGVLAVIR